MILSMASFAMQRSYVSMLLCLRLFRSMAWTLLYIGNASPPVTASGRAWRGVRLSPAERRPGGCADWRVAHHRTSCVFSETLSFV